MSREVRVYLEDIADACAKIARYTAGLSQAAFMHDEKTADAVIRNLQIVGEAVKSLPPELRDEAPEIEWRKVAGLRDIVVHQYFGIDLEVVWNIVEAELPGLDVAVRRLLTSRS